MSKALITLLNRALGRKGKSASSTKTIGDASTVSLTLHPSRDTLVFVQNPKNMSDVLQGFMIPPRFAYNSAKKGFALGWQDVADHVLTALHESRLPADLLMHLLLPTVNVVGEASEESIADHEGEGISGLSDELELWSDLEQSLPPLTTERTMRVTLQQYGRDELRMDVALLTESKQWLTVTDALQQTGLFYIENAKKKDYGVFPIWVWQLHHHQATLAQWMQDDPSKLYAFLQELSTWVMDKQSKHELILDDKRIVSQRTVMFPQFVLEARPSMGVSEEKELADLIPFHDDLPEALGLAQKETAVNAMQRAVRQWDGKTSLLTVEGDNDKRVALYLSPSQVVDFRLVKEKMMQQPNVAILDVLRGVHVPESPTATASFFNTFDVDIHHYGDRVIGLGPPVKMLGQFGKSEGQCMLDGIDLIEDDEELDEAKAKKPAKPRLIDRDETGNLVARIYVRGTESDDCIHVEPEALEAIYKQANEKHTSNELLEITDVVTGETHRLDVSTLSACEEVTDSVTASQKAWKQHPENPNFIGTFDDPPSPVVDDIGSWVLQILSNESALDYSTLSDDEKEERLDQRVLLKLDMKFTLFDYQKQGVEWLLTSFLKKRPGLLFADDMGLGKTVQTLAFIRLMMKGLWKQRCVNSSLPLDPDCFEGATCKHPILIVVPPILLKNFAVEAENAFHNGDDFRFLVLSGSTLRDYKRRTQEGYPSMLDAERLQQHRCIVTTYDTLANYEHSLAKINWSLVLCDEVQKAKSVATNVSRVLKAVASKAVFTILMSGTPIENSMNELWNLVDTAVPGLLGSLADFRKTYRPFFNGDKSTPEEKVTCFAQLNQQMKFGCFEKGYVNGRLKKDVAAKNLPKMIESTVTVSLNEDVKEQILTIVRSARPALKKIQQIKQLSIHPFLYGPAQRNIKETQRWMDASERLQTLETMLTDIATKGEKVLVFCEMNAYQAIVQNRINEQFASSFTAINSQLNQPQKEAVLENFKNTESFAALVLSPMCAGMGLNLQHANHVIHLSRWWNPAVEDQATCRAYRQGQRKDVHVYYFVADHPFELNLHTRLTEKRRLRSNLFDLSYLQRLDDASQVLVGICRERPDMNLVTIDALNKGSDAATGKAFEDIIKRLYEEQGYTVIPIKDRGLDWIFKKDGKTWGVQVKHKRGGLPYGERSDLERFNSTLETHQLSQGLFVTNGTFKPTHDDLRRPHIQWIDRNDLTALMETLQ